MILLVYGYRSIRSAGRARRTEGGRNCRCGKNDRVTAELANEQAGRANDAALIAHMKLQIES
jgi:hypothetical protein